MNHKSVTPFRPVSLTLYHHSGSFHTSKAHEHKRFTGSSAASSGGPAPAAAVAGDELGGMEAHPHLSSAEGNLLSDRDALREGSAGV